MAKVKAVAVEYMYRDGGNWKTHGDTLYFRGELTDALRDELLESTDGDGTFIAHQVGFEEVFPYAGDEDSYNEDEDHCYHELQEDMEQVEVDEDQLEGRTFEALVAEFRQAKQSGWQVFNPYTRLNEPFDLLHAIHDNNVDYVRENLAGEVVNREIFLDTLDLKPEEEAIGKTIDDRWTPLMLAAAVNADAIARMLVNERGADPSHRNNQGDTALDVARAHDCPATIDYLASLDQKDRMLQGEPELMAKQQDDRQPAP